MKLHPNMQRCTRLDVVRVLVEVNLQKSLTEKICFKEKDVSAISVLVSYPWLPPHCNVCSKWGHGVKDCQLSKNVTILSNKSESSPRSNLEQVQGELPKMNATDAVQGIEVGDPVPSVAEKASATNVFLELINDLEKVKMTSSVRSNDQISVPNNNSTQVEPISSSDMFSDQVAVINLANDLKENQIKITPGIDAAILDDTTWSVVTRSGRQSSPTRLSNQDKVTHEKETASPSGFQVLADLREEGEIDEKADETER